MKVLACVVSWNSAAELPAAIATLRQQTHPLDLVVIDNGSHDGSADVAERAGTVTVVRNTENRGFAGAANQGIAIAQARGADAFFLCNPDIRLEAGYLAAAVAALAEQPRRAAVQGKLWRLAPEAGQGAEERADAPATPPPGPSPGPVIDTTGHVAFATRLFRNRGEEQLDEGQYDEAGEVFGVSGAVALYRLGALEDVALDGEVFDEDLFAYWEDVDLDWRLQRRGWQAWYTPAARGWHERGGAGPRRSPMVERLNFANRFLVVVKNDDPVGLLLAAPGFVATSLLKGAELLLTVPGAFFAALGSVRLVPRMLAKRRRIAASATVTNRAVVRCWFVAFDYPAWVRTWWRRVRRERGAPAVGD